MALPVTERQRRWLDALLVLATIAVGFVVLGYLAEIFYFFGDTILIFFLAWLLAFILSPIVGRLVQFVPRLPRVVAVVLVYAALLGAFIVLAIVFAGAIARSISDFIGSVPQLRSHLPALLAPWQERLTAVGLGQVDLTVQAESFLNNLSQYASELVGPLQELAVASVGVLGNVLIVVILSLYIVIDRDALISFLFRLVPPAYSEEARLLEASVARSFGGFLRGQALMGAVYASIAALSSGILGLDYLPVTTAASGVLQAIPFFGPFVSWLPPVLVAMVLKPDATIPALSLMLIGWFFVMNVLQPRVMQEAVGIHPIVVLGSVLIGSKVAGITGAIFGIPIAAVLSSFFFHFLGRARPLGTVTSRAAQRLAAREGRPIRVPREPAGGVDHEVDEAAGRPARPPMAHEVAGQEQ